MDRSVAVKSIFWDQKTEKLEWHLQTVQRHLSGQTELYIHSMDNRPQRQKLRNRQTFWREYAI